MTALRPGSDGRCVSVVLHDVAPETRARCERLLGCVLAIADQAGVALRLSLLVVPMLHGAPARNAFGRWLRGLAGEGHEIVLHGLTHVDSAPLRGVADRLLRCWYTDCEGEFAAVDRAEAERRLAIARGWARRQRLAVGGFVAPAWLLSRAGWEAVAACGFDYTCTLTRVVSLRDRRALIAPSIVYSTRAPWRRGSSLAWNAMLFKASTSCPLLRIELHPDDIAYASVRASWQKLLERALAEREPVTLAAAARAIGSDRFDGRWLRPLPVAIAN